MNNYITIQPIDEKIDFVNLAITLSNVNSKSREDMEVVCKDGNFNIKNLTSNIQIHSDIVNKIDESNIGQKKEGDALITNIPNTPLLIFTADCVPIAIIDKKNKAIGLAHAGWRGTYDAIAKKTIEQELELKIGDDEVSNIAVHVGGAVERYSSNKKTKLFKVIIVCASGAGTSMLINTKVQQLFKDKIKIVKIIPSYLIDYINPLEIDFLISTMPLDYNKIPVINVSPFLTEKEIKIIMDNQPLGIERGIMDIWNVLTDSEKTLYIRYPFDALKANKEKNIAKTKTEAKFGLNSLGDKSDAFRHGIWNAELTVLIGKEKAELFATSHEDKDVTGNESDGYPKTEHRYMDLHNNAVGRTIGEKNSGASEDEMAYIIYHDICAAGTQFIWLHE